MVRVTACARLQQAACVQPGCADPTRERSLGPPPFWRNEPNAGKFSDLRLLLDVVHGLSSPVGRRAAKAGACPQGLANRPDLLSRSKGCSSVHPTTVLSETV